MIYSQFQDLQLSRLGFGAMRLPTRGDRIDEEQVNAMVDMALANGVNYFDTAWPYHNGQSEVVLGRALNRHPREKWYLANKYPGHQVFKSYEPAPIFEEQLRKCGVEYFDFYLLHNVYENSIDTYLDPQWNIIGYFLEQKRLGRIRHLGFSSHGSVDNLRTFLDAAGEHMEFCQIQLNYLDWTLQNAKAKVELLNERCIPVWVMEPLRGGALCRLSPEDETSLKALRPEEGIPAWGFRFLQDLPGVTVILSGMSNLAQMEENLGTFREGNPLTAPEAAALLQVAEHLKDCVPCTACRYCTPHCPKGLDIPFLLSVYNDLRFSKSTITAMRLDGLPADKQPSACIGCGKCARMCPQQIDIPGALKDMAEILKTIPSWAEVCRQREEAAKRLHG